MYSYVLITACHQIESFILSECDGDIEDFLDDIMGYAILPSHLFEPMVQFIYDKIIPTYSLLESCPESTAFSLIHRLLLDFECLCHKLFSPYIVNNDTDS